MFKKTLIALALTGFAGAASAAATITITPQAIALEGNSIASVGGSVVEGTDLTGGIEIAAGTAYIVNDLIYVTVSGATFDTTVAPTATATTAGTGDANFVDFADANTARFRVTTADWAAADDLTVTGFKLKKISGTMKTNILYCSQLNTFTNFT